MPLQDELADTGPKVLIEVLHSLWMWLQVRDDIIRHGIGNGACRVEADRIGSIKVSLGGHKWLTARSAAHLELIKVALTLQVLLDAGRYQAKPEIVFSELGTALVAPVMIEAASRDPPLSACVRV